MSLNLKPSVCYFGVVDDGSQGKTFGILKEDRRKHIYIVGKTGMGKTTLLQNMVLQDIYNGYGVAFVDPHGDSAEYIIDRIPAHRHSDVIYLNPADINFPVGLNILEAHRDEEPFLIASGLMAVFNKIWSGTWSARMEYILNNTLLALLETPNNTLLDVVRLLTDEKFRQKIVSQLYDPLVRNFWTQEFANFNSRYRQEAISPILNKIGQFLSSELMRNIIGQKKSTINIRSIMDTKKILIVNLSKGRLGEDNSNLFGSLLVAKLQVAALSRVDTPENKRQDFFVYVDEFQNFTNDSFATILSEARKYRLNLTIAHQYISQLTESGGTRVKNSIFGNIGSIIAFRLGSKDAEEMSREFGKDFNAQDFINLDPHTIALRMSIEGKVSEPFYANTLEPIFEKLGGNAQNIINLSRQRYTRARLAIQSEVSNIFNYGTGKNYPPKKSKNISQPANLSVTTKDQKLPSENILNLRSQSGTSSNIPLNKQIRPLRVNPLQPKIISEKISKFNQDKDKDSGGFAVPG